MQTDILIIGGGVAGLSAAARLAPHAKITLLEQERDLGYHTSGRSAALFEEYYGLPSTIALNRASRAFLETEDGGFLSPRGFLLVGNGMDDAAFEADVKTMQLTEISQETALSLVPILNPDNTKRFAHANGAHDIDTDRLLQHYTRIARQNGAEIITDAQVDALSRHGGTWQINTGEQKFNADIVINAAGAWASRIANLAGAQDIHIQPFRRSVARIPAPEGRDVSDWPLLFGPGETWYAKPDAGALIVSPAEEDPTTPHDAWAEDLTLAEGIARYQAVVTPEVTQMLSNWAGLRSFAPDRHLVIGFDGLVDGFFWCAGQGGYGMQSSPGASQLVADLILDRQGVLDQVHIDQLSPARFL